MNGTFAEAKRLRRKHLGWSNLFQMARLIRVYDKKIPSERMWSSSDLYSVFVWVKVFLPSLQLFWKKSNTIMGFPRSFSILVVLLLGASRCSASTPRVLVSWSDTIPSIGRYRWNKKWIYPQLYHPRLIGAGILKHGKPTRTVSEPMTCHSAQGRKCSWTVILWKLQRGSPTTAGYSRHGNPFGRRRSGSGLTPNSISQGLTRAWKRSSSAMIVVCMGMWGGIWPGGSSGPRMHSVSSGILLFLHGSFFFNARALQWLNASTSVTTANRTPTPGLKKTMALPLRKHSSIYRNLHTTKKVHLSGIIAHYLNGNLF